MMEPTNQAQDAVLDSALQQLRQDSAALRTPPAVEKALMAAFAARQRKLRWQRFVRQTLTPLIAVSATATVAAFMVFSPVQLAPVQDVKLTNESLAYQAAEGTPFVALATAEQIASDPSPHVVQAELPRAWLAGAGVPVAPDMAGLDVRAELLVGSNGEALAVRLMPE